MADADVAPSIILTVNGPGEVAGWLWPLTVALKARLPQVRLIACLLPCVFSSGAERGVIEALGTVDAVWDWRQARRLILRGVWPGGPARDTAALVVHMGGEPALSLMLARRLGVPAHAYVEYRPSTARFFERLHFSGLADVPAGMQPVGELMVDAAALRARSVPARSPEPVVALFPGSRDYMVSGLLGYFAPVVDDLARTHPHLSWVLAQSPFVPDAMLRDLPEPPRLACIHPVRYGEAGGRRWFETPGGVRIDILPGPEATALADRAITAPGTSTGDLAAAGVPMLVVLPLFRQAFYPLPGLAGWLGKLPLVGPFLREHFGRRLVARFAHLALPNRRAGARLVPEFVGEVMQPQIAQAMRDLLDRDCSALSDRLRRAMGGAGAADRLVGDIAATLGLTPLPPGDARDAHAHADAATGAAGAADAAPCPATGAGSGAKVAAVPDGPRSLGSDTAGAVVRPGAAGAMPNGHGQGGRDGATPAQDSAPAGAGGNGGAKSGEARPGGPPARSPAGAQNGRQGSLRLRGQTR